MKLIKLLLLVVLASVVIFFIGYKIVDNKFSDSCLPPPKPENVPLNSFWKGGCDGGNWYNILKGDSSSLTRLQIFRDNDGVLLYDGDFELSNTCNTTISLQEENLKKLISYYSGEFVGLENNCKLIPTSTVYGGEVLDIMKENEDDN